MGGGGGLATGGGGGGLSRGRGMVTVKVSPRLLTVGVDWTGSTLAGVSLMSKSIGASMSILGCLYFGLAGAGEAFFSITFSGDFALELEAGGFK